MQCSAVYILNLCLQMGKDKGKGAGGGGKGGGGAKGGDKGGKEDKKGAAKEKGGGSSSVNVRHILCEKQSKCLEVGILKMDLTILSKSYAMIFSGFSQT